MKPNTNIQKKKHHGRSPGVGNPGSGRPASPKRSRGFVLTCVLCVLLVGTGTWALFEFIVWNTTPPELVGKWEVVESPPEYAEATLEIFKNGRLVLRINDHGNLRILDAAIRVDGKKIYSTTTRPSTGEQKTTVMIIRTLTEKELAVEDEQGGVLKMERAR